MASVISAQAGQRGSSEAPGVLEYGLDLAAQRVTCGAATQCAAPVGDRSDAIAVRPSTAWVNVLLPEPDSPTTPKHSPSAISKKRLSAHQSARAADPMASRRVTKRTRRSAIDSSVIRPPGSVVAAWRVRARRPAALGCRPPGAASSALVLLDHLATAHHHGVAAQTPHHAHVVRHQKHRAPTCCARSRSVANTAPAPSQVAVVGSSAISRSGVQRNALASNTLDVDRR